MVFVILAGGVYTARWLVNKRKAPARKEHKKVAPLVKVDVIGREDIQMMVEGYGTVQPKVVAEIVPQVSGKVVAINPEFRNGGFLRAGEALVTIDPRDYELAVRSAEAEVARKQVDLDIAKAEADVAIAEWENMNPGKEPPSLLVVREPQVRQAQAHLDTAKAQLATAQLNLDRTKLSLPFDGRVAREAVDLGQYVMMGQSVGRIYGTEAVEIEVPLEDWELAWFDIPARGVYINGKKSKGTGSAVEVQADFAGGNHTWQGQVVRSTGEIDMTSRMVNVVVDVPDPFADANGRPPLVPGMFVKLVIKGRTLENAMAVPRYAIHNGNLAWVVNGGSLHITELDIVRKDDDFAYVVSGLEEGTVIVVSSLDAVTEGMAIRTESSGSTETADANGKTGQSDVTETN